MRTARIDRKFPQRRLGSAIALLAVATATGLLSTPLLATNAGLPPMPIAVSIDFPANAFGAGACPFDVEWSITGKAGFSFLPGNRVIAISPGGEDFGQVDAFMMSDVTKSVDDRADVHVQCFGSPDVHVINTQFVAIPTTSVTFQ